MIAEFLLFYDVSLNVKKIIENLVLGKQGGMQKRVAVL